MLIHLLIASAYLQQDVDGGIVWRKMESLNGTEDAAPVVDKPSAPEEGNRSAKTCEPLSAAMRAKIERNRQRALMLRQARLANWPEGKPQRSSHPFKQGHVHFCLGLRRLYWHNTTVFHIVSQEEAVPRLPKR